MNNSFFKYDSLASTNAELASLARNSLPEFSVVVADYQTNGRGQIGASWESEKGKNLLLSILFHPSFLPIKDFFLLSQFTSLAIIDFLSLISPSSEFSIKWPNDIYYKDKKLAGILIENSIQGSTISSSIVGIGLNVNQRTFLSDAPNPTSLSLFLGKEFFLPDLISLLISALRKRYAQLVDGDFDTIRNDYFSLLYRRNLLCEYEDANGKFLAVLNGVDVNGKLILKLPNDEIKGYYFKEVKFCFS